MSATRTDWEPANAKMFFAGLNGYAAIYGLPVTDTPTQAVQSGGSVPIGARSYTVTALDPGRKETLPSAAVVATTTSGNQKVLVTWKLVPNAASYRIYRDNTLITEVPATAYVFGAAGRGGCIGNQAGDPTQTQSFTDDGSLTPGAAAPTNPPNGGEARIVYEVVVTNKQSSTPSDVSFYENGSRVGSIRVTTTNAQGSWPFAGTEAGVALCNLAIVTSQPTDVTLLLNA